MGNSSTSDAFRRVQKPHSSSLNPSRIPQRLKTESIVPSTFPHDHVFRMQYDHYYGTATQSAEAVGERTSKGTTRTLRCSQGRFQRQPGGAAAQSAILAASSKSAMSVIDPTNLTNRGSSEGVVSSVRGWSFLANPIDKFLLLVGESQPLLCLLTCDSCAYARYPEH